MKIPSFQLTKYLLPMSAAAFICSIAHSAVLTPLQVISGFNQDIVVATGEEFYDVTTAFDPTAHWTWYELGRNTSPGDEATGLPTAPFASVTDPNITLQFASFTGNNALFQLNGQTGTLTLASPTILSDLAVFGSSADGSGTNAIVLNLQGGGTMPLSAPNSAQDWFFDDDGIALTVGGRINTETGTMQAFTGNNPRIYQDVYTFGTPVTVESISFSYTGAGRNAIMAVSGAVAVPEPSGLLFGLVSVGMMALMRRRSAFRA